MPSRKHRITYCALILICAGGLIVSLSLFNLAQVARAQTVTAPTATISDNTLPILPSAQYVGRAPRTRVLDLAVSLRLSDPGGVGALLGQLYDPGSPIYRQFITPEQFADEFGPSPAAYQATVAYLRQSGLTVEDTYANRLFVHASGTVAAAERAFGVHINSYQHAGQSFIANDRDPQMPAAIAGVVASVSGLQDYLTLHSHVRPGTTANQRHAATGTPPGYSPQQIEKAYDFTGAYAAGINGAGQTLAIATAYGFPAASVTTFWRQYGLKAPTYAIVSVGGTTRQNNVETTLDLERSGAMASGARILVYEGANSALNTFELVYNRIVAENHASVVTTSWGLCEPEMERSALLADSQIFAEAAAQGQTWFAAAGDDGAYDCGTSTLAVDYPASDASVAAAGGTTMTLNAAGTIASETAWSDGGGGLSIEFNQPPYQAGAGVENAFSDGARQVADLALNADPNTGYSVYFGSWNVYGGTSFAAPQWAAIFALINQTRGKAGRVGAAGPALYSLMQSKPSYGAFHDTLNGNNGYYPATSYWDYPTGWGTPDVWNLARDLE